MCQQDGPSMDASRWPSFYSSPCATHLLCFTTYSHPFNSRTVPISIPISFPDIPHHHHLPLLLFRRHRHIIVLISLSPPSTYFYKHVPSVIANCFTVWFFSLSQKDNNVGYPRDISKNMTEKVLTNWFYLCVYFNLGKWAIASHGMYESSWYLKGLRLSWLGPYYEYSTTQGLTLPLAKFLTN